MFEGHFIPATADSATEGAALRAPAWPELVARLAAAQDLRRAMARPGVHPAGNFDRFGERHAISPAQRERRVNPDGLVHGKGNGGMIPAAANGAVAGDRETR